MTSLRKAIECIEDHDLANALRIANNFVAAHPELKNTDEIDDISADLRRMLDYMCRGYADPARNELYNSLLKRALTAVNNLLCDYRNHHDELFIEASSHIHNTTFTHETIRSQLEDFVTETALQGEFSTFNFQLSTEKELYRSHQVFISSLFDRLLVSGQWRTADAQFYESLILSPTIENDDALVMVSAITLACMSVFDICKFTTLVNIYKKSDSIALQQRALVGWALCMNDEMDVFGEQEQIVREVCADENTMKQLVDMQKQIAFCMSAEKDHETIQRDILPTIIKNNNFTITRNGIIEKEEDPMDDILGHGDDDKRMEEMEESIQNMMNMQKEGSDIYFGGFSQMKRFPFFYKLVNWFTPFNPKHPDLANTRAAVGAQAGDHNAAPLQSLLEGGPFCDNDKYSLALAMASIINKLPKEMHEMLGNKDLAFPAEYSISNGSAAYVRRMYLQDLYRFFRLYPKANSIAGPFTPDSCVFIAGKNFQLSTLTSSTPSAFNLQLKYDLCVFYHKRKSGDEMGKILDAYNDETDAKCMLMHGIYELYYGNGTAAAIDPLRQALRLSPDNHRVRVLLARACMGTYRYDEAATLYRELLTDAPDNKGYSLNLALALAKAMAFEEAEQLLYKLQYEYPDDINVCRLLAWTLLGLQKTDAADKEYQRIMKHPEHGDNDYLNYGYCKWVTGDITGAGDNFKTFIASSQHINLHNEFEGDRNMLNIYGITDADIRLMEYAVCAIPR